ncbi:MULTISPECIES: hypothetical protein [unclassified Imperialibacter]|uniref:hypothetical protein n=1 Tax=unclassified Imperialibacter TaxID=2629706 RepID=UPI00125F292F|nr:MULTISPECIES: hypothetical protein [unclassified Imperialibacter]
MSHFENTANIEGTPFHVGSTALRSDGCNGRFVRAVAVPHKVQAQLTFPRRRHADSEERGRHPLGNGSELDKAVLGISNPVGNGPRSWGLRSTSDPLRCEVTAAMVGWCGHWQYCTKREHHHPYHTNVIPIATKERNDVERDPQDNGRESGKSNTRSGIL